MLNTGPSGAPPAVTIPSQSTQNDIRATAETYVGVGSSLGNGYTSDPPATIPAQPLSELITSGTMPQYDLMKQIESKVQNGSLTLDQDTLGDYGALVDVVGSLVDILTPIQKRPDRIRQRVSWYGGTTWRGTQRKPHGR